MRTGALTQRKDYTTPNYEICKLNAGGWQLIRDFQVPALASSEKLGILGDAIADVTGKTVTAVGGAAVVTDQYKFQEISSSIYFDGSGDYLTVPDSADWDFGTGAFTVDFWIRFTTVPSGTSIAVFSQYDDDNNGQVLFYDGVNWAYYNNTSGTYLSFSCPYTHVANTWYHIAIERISATDASTHRIYVNGVSQTLGISNATRTCGDFASVLYIGRYGGATPYYFNGYLSGLRVIKGSAIWTDATVSTPVYTDYNGSRSKYVAQNLDGNTDEEYRIVTQFVRGGATNSGLKLQCNSDSSANYSQQYVLGQDTTLVAVRDTSAVGMMLCAGTATSGAIGLSDIVLRAKSGNVRTAISTHSYNVSGVTVTGIARYGNLWNNISDNITSLTLISAVTNGLGVGSHILMFSRRKSGSDATSGIKTGDLNVHGTHYTGTMQLVERYEVTGSAVTSKTFSGLDGNTDVLYEVKVRVIGAGGNYNTAATFNSDTTAANYGVQLLRGSSTTASASRDTAQIMRLTYTDATDVGLGEAIIYAKSGYVRSALVWGAGYVDGTSIYNVDVSGHSWNNTADNITSIVVGSSGSGGLGVGTVIELWALRRKV